MLAQIWKAQNHYTWGPSWPTRPKHYQPNHHYQHPYSCQEKWYFIFLELIMTKRLSRTKPPVHPWGCLLHCPHWSLHLLHLGGSKNYICPGKAIISFHSCQLCDGTRKRQELKSCIVFKFVIPPRTNTGRRKKLPWILSSHACLGRCNLLIQLLKNILHHLPDRWKVRRCSLGGLRKVPCNLKKMDLLAFGEGGSWPHSYQSHPFLVVGVPTIHSLHWGGFLGSQRQWLEKRHRGTWLLKAWH